MHSAPAADLVAQDDPGHTEAMSNILIALESVNPLMPVGYDIAWSLVVLVMIVGAIAALVSIYRIRERMVGLEVALWVAVAVFLPAVGPLLWFVLGHRKTRETSSDKVQTTHP
jgi:hypothetical protein